jgi:hypothetical protein
VVAMCAMRLVNNSYVSPCAVRRCRGLASCEP